jgi:hypothetical protein
LFYVYPFRCQLCTTRFRSLQFRRYTRQAPDRREYDRLMVQVPVVVMSGTEHASGETVDLSLNGCSIRTEATFAPGATVQLRLRLGQAGDVQVQSAVVRTHRDGGLGLQFERLASADHERLHRYLSRFLLPSGIRRRRPGKPRPELVLAAAVGVGVIVVVFLLMARLGGPALR